MPALILSLLLASPVPAQEPLPGVPVQLKCEDGSTLNVVLLDPDLDLATRYGTLRIPVADVKRIEFATRVPPDVAAKIEAAVGNLGHPDYDVREAATKELKLLRGRAYFAATRAAKRSDPEVSRRAEDVCQAIRARAVGEKLDLVEADVVHTADSKITGRLTGESLRVRTAQFGEQRLRLADAVALQAGSVTTEVAEPAPANMTGREVGKEFAFVVTGAVPGAQGVSVWGSGPYTLDSSLAAAAVHAGLVTPGKSATVRVRVVASPPQFVGTAANGVTSSNFGVYPAGAFEFVK